MKVRSLPFGPCQVIRSKAHGQQLVQRHPADPPFLLIPSLAQPRWDFSIGRVPSSDHVHITVQGHELAQDLSADPTG